MIRFRKHDEPSQLTASDACFDRVNFKLNVLLISHGVVTLVVISMMYRIGVKLGALPWF